jgi:hypothetical protein
MWFPFADTRDGLRDAKPWPSSTAATAATSCTNQAPAKVPQATHTTDQAGYPCRSKSKPDTWPLSRRCRQLVGDILVGNFGTGRSMPMKPRAASSVGSSATLTATANHRWAVGLRFPTTSLNVTDPNALYFTAGINKEADGLFGTLTPSPQKDTEK